MEILINLIGVPLGYLMYWCYELLSNYGVAILLFTLLTKVILFPLSLIAQKNSIIMVKMQPALADIKSRNAGNGELIMQETKALYKKERYSTIKGLLPLLIQIPIILGLIDVIYKPLQHLLHIDNQIISSLVQRASEVLGVTTGELGMSAQLRVLELAQSSPDVFSGIGDSVTSIIAQLNIMDVSFLGLDLSALPQFGSITLIIPILSAVSALLLCLAQNRYNVLQANAGFISRWGMLIFLVCFSGYFAMVLPSGLGLYWTAGNLLSIPVLALCNIIYSPWEYMDRNTRATQVRPSREERAVKRKLQRELAEREKADSKRFFAPGLKKNLVVYSEGSGFWKYFAALVNYVTENSDTVVHYVTNDPNDRIFETKNEQIVPYYIGSKAFIAFMMKMDADIVIMTTPDLETFHVKRSLVRKDVEYIYLDHGAGSFQLMLRKNALDHFDTVFIYGPNQIAEIRETEKLYNLPAKTLVKTGYGLNDELLERVAEIEAKEAANPNAKKRTRNKQILIAPSWQTHNIMDLCIDEMIDEMYGHGYRIIVRPHPEYVKRFPDRMKAFSDRQRERCDNTDEKGGSLSIETDFSSNETVYLSDLLITDWSSIAQEFSYATKKPSLFINTPMKIMNPEYDLLPLVPLEISMRSTLGVSVDTDKLDTLVPEIKRLTARKGAYRKRITKLLENNLYDIGGGARWGGEYLIARVKEIEYLRSVGKDPADYAKPTWLKAADKEKAERKKKRAENKRESVPQATPTTAKDTA